MGHMNEITQEVLKSYMAKLWHAENAFPQTLLETINIAS